MKAKRNCRHRRLLGVTIALSTLWTNWVWAGLILQNKTDGGSLISYCYPEGQSFTAEDSKIASIGFAVSDFNPYQSNGVTLVHLYDGVGTTGTLLYTSSLIIPPGGGFLDWDFTPVSLIVGDQYTAILEDNFGRWGDQSSNGDPYPGGDRIRYGSPVPGMDLRFRVVPIPEPTTLALVFVGFGGVIAFRRRVKSPQLSITEAIATQAPQLNEG